MTDTIFEYTDTIFEYKEPENPQTIGELVRALRVKCGMTQGELAQMARITVRKAALLEADKTDIGGWTVDREDGDK
jgi:hypothetical protein